MVRLGNVIGREWLEADPAHRSVVDLANIVPRGAGRGPLEEGMTRRPAAAATEKPFAEDFMDDPDVPALI
ncbi:unnamed protein product [Merluccius merluccius]